MKSSRFVGKDGAFCFVLNAHLPYVRFPQNNDFLEERWLYEAMLESYLPLVRVFRRLEADGVPYRFTLAVSPTLTAMIGDKLLQDRFIIYAKSRLELAEKEIKRLEGDPLLRETARNYYDRAESALEDFALYGNSLTHIFKALTKTGNGELITTAATSAFLPLYAAYPQAVRAQLHAASLSHRAVFGEVPAGYWLPYFGYYPSLDAALRHEGARYFLMASHGALYARAPNGVYEPLRTEHGIAAFPRDRAAVYDVWDPTRGDRGSAVYRDFYRDIGFDLPQEYIGPYAFNAGRRTQTGFKYCCVTGNTDRKWPYDIKAAADQCAVHAKEYVRNRLKEIAIVQSCKKGALPSLMNAFYDAELFGHRWYEGPAFIESVFRELAISAPSIAATTPSEYLDVYENVLPNVDPAFSGLGEDGYAQPWIDEKNDDLLRHIYRAIEKMSDLARRFTDASGLKKRVLNQAAREVLLAMAGDWPLMIKADVSADFAKDQIRRHLGNFYKIYEAMGRNVVKTEWLTAMEKQNALFMEDSFSYLLFKKS